MNEPLKYLWPELDEYEFTAPSKKQLRKEMLKDFIDNASLVIIQLIAWSIWAYCISNINT